MSESAYKMLDQFGEGVMANVRDDALAYFDRLTSGNMADAMSQELYARYQALNSEDAKLARELMAEALNAGIVRFLHHLDEHQYKLFARDDIDKQYEIIDASDGLAGELYCEDGWTARFGRYPE